MGYKMNIDELNLYLQKESKNICEMNECTEDAHNCESYAYINMYGNLMDICISDYFSGSSKPYCAIPLPWDSEENLLQDEILDQCWEQIDCMDEPERKKLKEEMEEYWMITL